MTLAAKIIDLKARLAGAGVPLSKALNAAGIDRSTWNRWQANKTSPRMNNWDALCQAVDDLSAACSPASDSTAVHGDAASPDPIPETVAPPPPDHVTGDRAVASAGDAG